MDANEEVTEVTIATPQWARLKALAAALADGKIAPSPQQVGIVLLRLALRSAEPAALVELLRRELGATSSEEAN